MTDKKPFGLEVESMAKLEDEINEIRKKYQVAFTQPFSANNKICCLVWCEENKPEEIFDKKEKKSEKKPQHPIKETPKKEPCPKKQEDSKRSLPKKESPKEEIATERQRWFIKKNIAKFKGDIQNISKREAKIMISEFKKREGN